MFKKFLLLGLISVPVYANEYHLIDVDKLDIEYLKLNPNNRDSYAPQYTGSWNERAAIKWDVSFMGLIFWDNNVHMETVTGGVPKTVGWEFEAGVHLTK